MIDVATEKDLWDVVGGSDMFLLDFYTTWCGPCKRITPFLEEMEQLYPSILFCKIDGDVATELIDFFDIRGFPTFIIGTPQNQQYTVLSRIVGADQDELGGALREASQVLSPTPPLDPIHTLPSFSQT